MCPLNQHIALRIVTYVGIDLSNVVSDVVMDGVWSCPHSWTSFGLEGMRLIGVLSPHFLINSFAQPIGIEEAYKITWIEFKKILIKKYFPLTEIQKMEDEFYHLTVKGNDLKTYVRRFQELATLCPTMVSDSEKLLEAFIRGLPRSIEKNVTASKSQTLEEAINIAQRIMDQVTKHNHVQETNDHKRKLDDKRNTNNNYPKNRDHNL
nr:reverse transcriptase domain-containing protein [Tanacetum cinerariifolium]